MIKQAETISIPNGIKSKVKKVGSIEIGKLNISKEKFNMLCQTETYNDLNNTEVTIFSDNGKKDNRKKIKIEGDIGIQHWCERACNEVVSGTIVNNIILQNISSNIAVFMDSSNKIKSLVIQGFSFGDDIKFDDKALVLINNKGKIIYEASRMNKRKFIEQCILKEFKNKKDVVYTNDGRVQTPNFVGTYKEIGNYIAVDIHMYHRYKEKERFTLLINKDSKNIRDRKVFRGYEEIRGTDGLVALEKHKGRGSIYNTYMMLIDVANSGRTLIKGAHLISYYGDSFYIMEQEGTYAKRYIFDKEVRELKMIYSTK